MQKAFREGELAEEVTWKAVVLILKGRSTVSLYHPMKADPPLTQEAWHRLQGWYKATVDRPPPPARATLKRVTAERTTLYSRVPPQETPSQSQSNLLQWRMESPRRRKWSGR